MKMGSRLILVLLCCISATTVRGGESGSGDVPRTLEDLATRYVKARAIESLLDRVDLTHPEDISRAEDTIKSLIPGCASTEELEQIGLGEVSELHTQQPGELFRRIAAIDPPATDRTLPTVSVQIIGQVRESDFRHVVYRTRTEGEGKIIVSEIGVMTARKYRGEWLAALQDDLAGFLLEFSLATERWCRERE